MSATPVRQPILLRDGDELRFGDAVARYRCTHRPESDTSNTLPDRPRRLEDVRERACWLLLADIAGYSALDAELGSTPALQRLQAWIAGMRAPILKHGGNIDRYAGDTIFAWWPASGPDSEEPVRAALAALEAWRRQSPVEFRIVLHHGAVLFTRSERGEELGGQEVNFLRRLKKIAKTFGTLTMLSQAAAHTLQFDGRCPALGAAPVEGIQGRFVFFGAPRAVET